jgi:hypothetical protein
MAYDYADPPQGLSYREVGAHLQFTLDELNAQQEDASLLIAIIAAAVAHTENLCGPLPDPPPDDLVAAVKIFTRTASWAFTALERSPICPAAMTN